MAAAKRGHGSPSDWWADQDELIAFARVLVETGYLGDPHRVIDFFREPRRWTYAYRIWSELGRPERYGQYRVALTYGDACCLT